MKRNISLAIVHLLHGAKQNIMYPKVRLGNEDRPIQLSVAGDKSRNPGAINVTDGGPYGDNKYYGCIHPDGTTKFNTTKHGMFTINEIEAELELFIDDPAGYAKMYAQGTGNCMYCLHQLTDPQSVAVGYGPICAANYGLPHGEMDQKTAEAMSEIEFDLEDVQPVDNINERSLPIEDNSTQSLSLEERVTIIENIIANWTEK